MAYAELVPIVLGSSQTGLTLRAVLREPDSGSVVNFADAAAFKNTGFVERGLGEYSFYSDQFPDGFQGMVEIQLDGDQSYKASATVSPPVALASELDAVRLKTDNLPTGIKKNTGLSSFEFLMVDTTDGRTPKTGLTVTAERSIDGAAFAGCANLPAEVGNGVYAIDLAAGDLNGDVITLRFTAAGADPTLLTIKTNP